MACLPACNYCACYGFIRHPYRFVGRKNSATHIGIAGANAINRRSSCFRLNSASDCQKRLQFHRLDAFESSSFPSLNAAYHSDPSEVEEDVAASEVEEDGVRTPRSSAPSSSSDSSDPVVQTGYPNPSSFSYEKRLFCPFEYALQPPQWYKSEHIAISKPEIPCGLSNLKQYDGPQYSV